MRDISGSSKLIKSRHQVGVSLYSNTLSATVSVPKVDPAKSVVMWTGSSIVSRISDSYAAGSLVDETTLLTEKGAWNTNASAVTYYQVIEFEQVKVIEPFSFIVPNNSTTGSVSLAGPVKGKDAMWFISGVLHSSGDTTSAQDKNQLKFYEASNTAIAASRSSVGNPMEVRGYRVEF